MDSMEEKSAPTYHIANREKAQVESKNRLKFTVFLPNKFSHWRWRTPLNGYSGSLYKKPCKKDIYWIPQTPGLLRCWLTNRAIPTNRPACHLLVIFRDFSKIEKAGKKLLPAKVNFHFKKPLKLSYSTDFGILPKKRLEASNLLSKEKKKAKKIRFWFSFEFSPKGTWGLEWVFIWWQGTKRVTAKILV